MAKYEKRFKGNFDELLDYLHDGILRGSSSASYEDGSDVIMGDEDDLASFQTEDAINGSVIFTHKLLGNLA